MKQTGCWFFAVAVILLGMEAKAGYHEKMEQIRAELLQEAKGDITSLPPECKHREARLREELHRFRNSGVQAAPQPVAPPPTVPSVPVADEAVSPPLERTHRASLANVASLADEARARETMVLANRKIKNEKAQAIKTSQYLEKQYKNLEPAQLKEYFQRSEETLHRLVYSLGKVRESAPSDQRTMEATRLIDNNIAQNASDLAQAAREVVASEQPAAAKPWNSKKLQDLLGSGAPVESQDARISRVLLYFGLPDAERKKMLKDLGLSSDKLLRAHAFGQDAEMLPMDCATLLNAVVSPATRREGLSTMDLRGIWHFLQEGILPDPPRWTKERAAFLKKAADAFQAFHLSIQNQPKAGDLLVFWPKMAIKGDAFLVREYDPQRMIAKVVHNERELPLAIERFDAADPNDPFAKPSRYIRPGFLGLRLKATDNAFCHYRDGKR